MTKIFDHLEEILISCLMVAATTLIFVAVIHRYGTGLSINGARWATSHGLPELSALLMAMFTWFASWDLSWAQELCIIMFVWMAKFGAAYGVRTGVHVGVDVVLNNLTTPSKYWAVIFGLCCGALFTFIIGSFGARFVFNMAQTKQTTNDLEMPMWLVYMAIPAGSFLMCFRFLQVAYAFAHTGALPHTDESHVEGVSQPTQPQPQAA
jgi:C4-dicarboxylate transporter DctM subunit